MRIFTKEELREILGKHLKWLLNNEGGERADLYGANLYGADLYGANLSRANLSRAKNIDKTLNIFYPICCPEYGIFIGWKKGKDNTIIKLEICEDALRCSATSRKCRCNKAKVLEITDRGGNQIKNIPSNFDNEFIYTVGKISEVEDFDRNRWEECSTGIHFFITKEEAERW